MKPWTGAHFGLSAGLAGIGILVLVALAVAASVSQAQVGPDDLKAPEGDPGLDVLACYEIEVLTPVPPPPLRARLVTDNFGGDVVNIFGNRSPLFCESAVKTSTGDAAVLPYGKLGDFVFQCFEIEQGANPDDELSLLTHNFGTEPVTVGRADQMCESARKQHFSGIAPLGHPGRMAMHCFAVEPVRDDAGNLPNHGQVELTTKNFGTEVASLGPTTHLCEEAAKHTADPDKPDVGKPTGRVWQCIQASPDPVEAHGNIIGLTTSNFGPMGVVVGSLIIMCEKAKKVYSLSATPVRP